MALSWSPSRANRKIFVRRPWSRRLLLGLTLLLAIVSALPQTGLDRRIGSHESTLFTCMFFLLGFVQILASQRREREELLAAANTDLLTGLPNRRYFMHELGQALTRRRFSSTRGVAVLLIDLDRFKLVNDSFGHAAGDALLREAAERLRLTIGPSDILARLGGDEFVVLRQGVTTTESAERLARRIIESFELPFRIDGQQVVVLASVGMSFGQPGAVDSDELLIKSDIAMYEAKEDKGSGLAVFHSGSAAMDRSRLSRESELRQAIATDGLVLYFQPQFSLSTLELQGFEVLVRWQHPKLGLLLPKDFVPMAEESGLISELGRWVIRRSCMQLAEWQAIYGPAVELSVNLSAIELRRADLLHDLTDLLEEIDVAPRNLTFEITETVLLRDPEAAATTLGVLRERGAKVAIDDFGTGYCSLSYLSRLLAEILKIDRSFVVEAHAGREYALLKSIVELAHALGLTAVLEGIETREHLGAAIGAGYDIGQGFFLGRPLPKQAAEELLTTHAADFEYHAYLTTVA